MKAFILILVLGSLFAGGSSLYFLNVSPGDASEKLIFEVSPNSSFNKVLGDLDDEGLIANKLLFKVLARVMGYTKKIRVGEYELNKGMRPLEVLDTLATGKSIMRPLTFKEGLNMYEVADMIEAAGLGSKTEFLRLCKDKTLINELLRVNVPNLEGYLYPETYMVTKYTTEKELIKKMIQNSNRVFKKVASEINATGLSRHELVILASIIEKETGAPEERPMISSVFHNRLRKKMRLQTDPTILYGILDKTGEMKNNIRKKDILAYTRYNTYRINGLPYGPISNPGEASLRAALNPADSKNLYFVSRNDGTSVFSTNLKDHNKAVKKFQLDRRMREGRSWRDRLQKKKSTPKK